MGEDRTSARLLKTSQKVVFCFIAFERSREKLVDLDRTECSSPRNANAQHGPVATIKHNHEDQQRDGCSSEIFFPRLHRVSWLLELRQSLWRTRARM